MKQKSLDTIFFVLFLLILFVDGLSIHATKFHDKSNYEESSTSLDENELKYESKFIDEGYCDFFGESNNENCLQSEIEPIEPKELASEKTKQEWENEFNKWNNQYNNPADESYDQTELRNNFILKKEDENFEEYYELMIKNSKEITNEDDNTCLTFDEEFNDDYNNDHPTVNSLNTTEMPQIDQTKTQPTQSTTQSNVESQTKFSESKSTPIDHHNEYHKVKSTNKPMVTSDVTPKSQSTTKQNILPNTTPIIKSTTKPVTSTDTPKVQYTTKPIVTSTVTHRVQSTTKPIVTSTVTHKVQSTTKPIVTSTVTQKVQSTTKPIVTSTVTLMVQSTAKQNILPNTTPIVKSTAKPVVTIATKKNIEFK